MANTTNYNLKKPAYSDTADIADINSNMDIIDSQMKTNADGVSANNTSIENIEDGIAYRLGNTNTTGATLAVGTYVYVSGNSTLADGLYKVSTAIAANATLSSSNCTAVSGGGLNALNSKLASQHFDLSKNPSIQTSSFKADAYKSGNVVTITGYIKPSENISVNSVIITVPNDIKLNSFVDFFFGTFKLKNKADIMNDVAFQSGTEYIINFTYIIY